jgi:hypothetical protein
MKPAILTLLYILISPLLAHSANPKTSWSGIAKEAANRTQFGAMMAQCIANIIESN